MKILISRLVDPQPSADLGWQKNSLAICKPYFTRRVRQTLHKNATPSKSPGAAQTLGAGGSSLPSTQG